MRSRKSAMSGHGDPPRQGMVLEEVTLPRRGGLGVFSNDPWQRIVERGARIFPRGGCDLGHDVFTVAARGGCHGEEALTFLPWLHRLSPARTGASRGDRPREGRSLGRRPEPRRFYRGCTGCLQRGPGPREGISLDEGRSLGRRPEPRRFYRGCTGGLQ